MAVLKKKWRGKSPWRLASNSLEKEFALAWQRENDRPMGGGPLDYILQPERQMIGVRPDVATPEQRSLSCTLIQWLGTPVGQAFLEGVLRTKAGREFLGSRLGLPSCPGIEVKPGHYSGCGGGKDCPTCHGQWSGAKSKLKKRWKTLKGWVHAMLIPPARTKMVDALIAEMVKKGWVHCSTKWQEGKRGMQYTLLFTKEVKVR